MLYCSSYQYFSTYQMSENGDLRITITHNILKREGNFQSAKKRYHKYGSQTKKDPCLSQFHRKLLESKSLAM